MEVGIFSRLWKLNNPKHFVYIGIIAALMCGCCQPVWAVFYSGMISYLTVPLDMLGYVYASNLQNGEEADDFVMRQSYYVIGAAFVLVAFNGIGFFLRNNSFGTLSENLTNEIQQLMYRSLLQKHIGWFDDRNRATSVLTSTMAEGTARINDAGSTALQPVITAGMSLTVGLSLSAAFCWPMALGALAVIPLQVAGVLLQARMSTGQLNFATKEMTEPNLLLGDSIMNFRTVQSFGYEELIVKKYVEMMKPIDDMNWRVEIYKSFFQGGVNFLNFLTNALLFLIAEAVFSAESLQKYNFTSRDIFTAIFCMLFAGQAIGQTLGYGPDIGKAQSAATKVFEFVDSPSAINALEMTEKKLGRSVDHIEGKIEFRNVWFRYPSRKTDFVLKGLNLTIMPNESVALVGESGCGKSTFVNLMMRFYDPDSGEIYLDDVNIKEYNLHELRRAFSIVMQEPVIFNYTILDNILYGKSNATNSDVLKACEMANCMDFIERSKELEEGKLEDSQPSKLLKLLETNKDEIIKSNLIDETKFNEWVETLKLMDQQEQKKGKFQYQSGDIDTRDDKLKDVELHEGFDIVTGYRGSKLSGGQKQRVAIARTVIREPRVLMLDEATSALDEDSQKKVQVALEQASANRTTIIIAHRMSTIERCDKIFVLEHGTVKEEGNFSSLKDKGGLFTKLSKARMG